MSLGWTGRQGVRESKLQACGVGATRRAEASNIWSHFAPADSPLNLHAPRNSGISDGNLLQERLNGKQFHDFASFIIYLIFFWYLLISGETSTQDDPPPVEMSPQRGPSRVREDPEKTEELVVVCIEEFEHIPTQSF